MDEVNKSNGQKPQVLVDGMERKAFRFNSGWKKKQRLEEVTEDRTSAGGRLSGSGKGKKKRIRTK